MTATNTQFSIFAHFRNKTIKRAARRQLMTCDEITDPYADHFFTIIDGEPVTFGEFNARMEQHFENEKLKGGRYE